MNADGMHSRRQPTMWMPRRHGLASMRCTFQPSRIRATANQTDASSSFVPLFPLFPVVCCGCVSERPTISRLHGVLECCCKNDVSVVCEVCFLVLRLRALFERYMHCLIASSMHVFRNHASGHDLLDGSAFCSFVDAFYLTAKDQYSKFRETSTLRSHFFNETTQRDRDDEMEFH